MEIPESNDGVSVLIKHKWKIALATVILFFVVSFTVILLPLMDGLILGIVLAYVARPTKRYLDRFIPKASPYIATIVIVLPVFLIIGLGVIEMFNQVLWAIQNHVLVLNTLMDLVDSLNLPGFIEDKTKDILVNFTSYLIPFIRQLPVGTIIKSFTMFVINTVIAIILCFFLLVDGQGLIDKIIDIIPADVNEFSKKFITHLDGILSAIFIGNTYSAIAVGILSLVVFTAFGFKNVMALSALMLIAAIVPVFAGYMVITLLAVYRYFNVGSHEAIVFFVVSIVVIILPPEFLLRPYIIHTHSKIHPMLIIIAFIGGGLVGGIAGFFVAPILLGAIIAAYRTNADIRKSLNT